MDINEIIEYIDMIPEFKPVVRKVLDGLKAYEEEYSEITDFVIDRTVANKIKMYKAFQAAGISDDHSLALVVNAYQEFKKVSENLGKNVSAKKADK